MSNKRQQDQEVEVEQEMGKRENGGRLAGARDALGDGAQKFFGLLESTVKTAAKLAVVLMISGIVLLVIAAITVGVLTMSVVNALGNLGVSMLGASGLLLLLKGTELIAPRWIRPARCVVGIILLVTMVSVTLGTFVGTIVWGMNTTFDTLAEIRWPNVDWPQIVRTEVREIPGPRTEVHYEIPDKVVEVVDNAKVTMEQALWAAKKVEDLSPRVDQALNESQAMANKADAAVIKANETLAKVNDAIAKIESWTAQSPRVVFMDQGSIMPADSVVVACEHAGAGGICHGYPIGEYPIVMGGISYLTASDRVLQLQLYRQPWFKGEPVILEGGKEYANFHEDPLKSATGDIGDQIRSIKVIAVPEVEVVELGK